MRHIVVTFVFCLLVISAQAGTYKNDFTDGNLDGWEVFNETFQPGMEGISEWKVENGVLICRRPEDNSSALVFGEKEWRNYSIECDAQIVQILSNFHSIALDLRRVKKDINAVWCNVGSWGQTWSAGIEVWFNNAGGKKSRKNFPFELNRWYRLKGIANEENFEFYIDGELMASVTDSHFPTGYVDLNANGCLAHFDNVVITGDDVPDNPSAVSSPGNLATTWGQMKSP